jgi:hypothetical protein
MIHRCLRWGSSFVRCPNVIVILEREGRSTQNEEDRDDE